MQLPQEIIDRRVTKMKMISPSNVEVDVGRTLADDEYIGMVRREVLDAFLRNRAESYGAKLINGLFLRMDIPKDETSPYVLHYSDYAGDSKVHPRHSLVLVPLLLLHPCCCWLCCEW